MGCEDVLVFTPMNVSAKWEWSLVGITNLELIKKKKNRFWFRSNAKFFWIVKEKKESLKDQLSSIWPS